MFGEGSTTHGAPLLYTRKFRKKCPREFDEIWAALPGSDFRTRPPPKVELVNGEDFSYVARIVFLFDECTSAALLAARNRICAGESPRPMDKLSLMISSLHQPGRRYGERIEDRPADGQQCRDWRAECKGDHAAFDDSWRAWLERHLRVDNTGRRVERVVTRSEEHRGKHYWHCLTCSDPKVGSWLKTSEYGTLGPICRACVPTPRPRRLDWHDFGLIHLLQDERFIAVPSDAPRVNLTKKRVEIHGTSRADLNGKFGDATEFHPGYNNDPAFPARYTVMLDGGKVLKFNQANVIGSRGYLLEAGGVESHWF